MKRSNVWWLRCVPLLLLPLSSQACIGQEREVHRIMFYNVENLFDTTDDRNTMDEDFTPGGKKHWTRYRYVRKLRMLAEVVDSVGKGEWPLLVGLAEVENRRVLEDLVSRTALAEAGYGIVHQDSPDARGIDVALLYRKDEVQLLGAAFHGVSLLPESATPTRDILYARMKLSADTFHFFVCHFPSMRGGERQSEWKRIRAASVLRGKVDSLFAMDAGAYILVMGDFNGRANTAALRRLGVEKPERRVREGVMYNTGWYLMGQRFKGSYRYKGDWQTIDHILVSGSLLMEEGSWKADRRMEIFSPPFLLEEETRYFGYLPWATYRGLHYRGGYSDHLPLFIALDHKD